MRPRHKAAGNEVNQETRASQVVTASMRPRHKAAGNGAPAEKFEGVVYASMRPRHKAAGNGVSCAPAPTCSTRFNEAAA